MHFEWTRKLNQKFERYYTIQFRLTTLYLFIFGSTLIVFAMILYRSFRANQQNAFDIALFNHAIDISQGITVGPFGELMISPDVLTLGGRIFPFPTGSAYLQILTRDGIEIGRSKNLGKSHLPFLPEEMELLRQNRAVFRSIGLKELKLTPPPRRSTRLRLVTALTSGQARQDFILQVAVSEEFLSQASRGLRRFLLISIPLSLFSAALAGFYLSRRALIPVRRMIDQANRLSPQSLSDRIPVPTADDEIQSLSLTLNALLNRLERAFVSQERFIADASHELKTPLAILRGELDVFRSRSRTPEETTILIENVREEIDHLSRMVEDLLILARVDVGSAVIVKDKIQLEEIVFEVISKLEILARLKNIKIRFNLMPEENSSQTESPSFSTQGDSDLIQVLIKNLIENAIKYSPSHQIVEISLTCENENVVFSISNTGPGIPPVIISKIFDRFYRGPLPEHSGSDASCDHHRIQGAGLGLAIVQKIAEIHEAHVSVSSSPGQTTTFTLKIKKF
jgi:signal transduction histidine kinase